MFWDFVVEKMATFTPSGGSVVESRSSVLSSKRSYSEMAGPKASWRTTSEYDVHLGHEALGFRLEQRLFNGWRIASVEPRARHAVAVDDELIAVNGHTIQGASLDLLKAAVQVRPLTLTFHRAPGGLPDNLLLLLQQQQQQQQSVRSDPMVNWALPPVR